MVAIKRPKFQVVWDYIVLLKVSHDPTDKYEQKGNETIDPDWRMRLTSQPRSWPNKIRQMKFHVKNVLCFSVCLPY